MTHSETSSHFSVKTRSEIISLYQSKLSYRKMAFHFHVSVSTVCYTVQRFIETGENESRPGRGRHKVLSAKDVACYLH